MNRPAARPGRIGLFRIVSYGFRAAMRDANREKPGIGPGGRAERIEAKYVRAA
ncbi:hypothetical protein AAFM48_24295 [Burkholderia pseudomallei]